MNHYMRMYMPMLCLLALLSCRSKKTEGSPEAEKKPEKTIISGFVSGDAAVHLQRWDARDLLDPMKSYAVRMEGGYFKIELEMTSQQLVTLIIADRSVLRRFGGFGLPVAPGDSLYIEIPDLDDADLTRAVLSGRGSEKLKLFRELTKRVLETPYEVPPLRQTIGQRVEVALIRKNILEEMMEEYRDKIADEYHLMIRANVVAAIYNDAARFFFKEDLAEPQVIRLYEEQFKPAFPLADDLTPELILSGDAHRKVLQDMALLDHLVSHKISNTKEYKTDKKRLFDILREAYALTPVKDWLLAGFIVDRAKHDGWDTELEACVTDFYLDAPEEHYYEQVKHIRDQVRSRLAGFAPAYDFSLPDKDGNIIGLKDFRGKAVLIDFNFYGCVGCKLMVPALEALEHRFAANDKVVFVSISADRSKERFIKSIGTFSSSGSFHLYTEGEGFGHPVIKAYGIASYPTLALIDAQGRIVTARAPDPRSEEGMKELMALIRSTM